MHAYSPVSSFTTDFSFIGTVRIRVVFVGSLSFGNAERSEWADELVEDSSKEQVAVGEFEEVTLL